MISKVYYLKNEQGYYAYFDAYGWDYTHLFLFAHKFSVKAEAIEHKNLANYVSSTGDLYKVYSRKLKYK